MSSRRGFTLVEALFGLALMLVVVVVAWTLFGGAAGGEAQLDRVAARTQALGLLREHLTWDLARSISPEAGGAFRVTETSITLTVCEHPPGGTEVPRIVSYRFDPAQGALLRDGVGLSLGKLTSCHIAPAPGRPAELQVQIAGGDVGAPSTLVLPLGIAVRSLAGWTVDGALVAGAPRN